MTYVIVALAVLARFAPHPPNFSPVFGALLFGGARLRPRDSIWFPVALLAASDVVLTTQVYHVRMGLGEALGWLAFGAVALMGRWLRNRVSMRTVMSASLAGPTAFFLISNFSVWLGWRMYPPSGAGLLACYAAALPFFGNSLLASLLFTGLLFGAEGFFRRQFAGRELANSVRRLHGPHELRQTVASTGDRGGGCTCS